jgi:hypothetical protein
VGIESSTEDDAVGPGLLLPAWGTDVIQLTQVEAGHPACPIQLTQVEGGRPAIRPSGHPACPTQLTQVEGSQTQVEAGHPACPTQLTQVEAAGWIWAARPLFERVLAIDEATYGPDHPEVAMDLSNLASAHQDLGAPALARPLLERAIAIATARLPPNHPHLAIYRGNLAGLGPSR